MLEFIVLGQIPGTSIQITFSQLIKLSLLVIAGVLISYELRRHKISRPRLQDIINRLAL